MNNKSFSFCDRWKYHKHTADNPLGTKDINSQMYAVGFTTVKYGIVNKKDIEREESFLKSCIDDYRRCKTDKDKQDKLACINLTKGRLNALNLLYNTNKKRFADYCEELNKKELGV